MSEIEFLSYGLVAGRPVFMDERHDSYFLLEESTEAEFLDLIESEGTLEAGGSASLRSALGAPHGSPRIALARPPHAGRSLLDEIGAASRARIRDALSVGLLLRRARSAIATKPIRDILFDLAHGMTTARQQVGDGEIVRDAGRFIAARRVVPHASNCLTDSLALVHWLERPRGVLLVFGVKLEPFGAHCWVQLGDLLLNDRLDTIAQFRPVRVIECAPATL
jgi:hypothetical protein